MEHRQSFTFYRSFYDAVVHLEPIDRDAVMMALCAYALDGEESSLSGVPAALFTLIRPNLDASRKKASSGQAGGSAQANAKQTESKPQANVKQTGSNKELGVRNKELGTRSTSVSPQPPKGEPKVQWAENVTMTNAQHEKLLAAHGPADTARLIEILDNYKGSTGKHYRDDYRAILSWCVDRLAQERAKPPVGKYCTPTTDGQANQRVREDMERMREFMRKQEADDGQG